MLTTSPIQNKTSNQRDKGTLVILLTTASLESMHPKAIRQRILENFRIRINKKKNHSNDRTLDLINK